MGRAVTSGQLVSRVGDGDVPEPEEDDYKGNVPLLAAESEKEISYLALRRFREISATFPGFWTQ
jgi:hypothetical protein